MVMYNYKNDNISKTQKINYNLDQLIVNPFVSSL